MAPEPTSTPDDEPTKVSPAAGDPATGAGAPSAGDPVDPPKDVVTDAPLWPDPPRVEHTTPPASAHTPPAGAGRTFGDEPRIDRDPDELGEEPPAEEPAPKSRGRSAADRTAGGAKVAADRVSQAASATAQALRETDVGEIARNTTKLIENTRPFFLAAFAIVFTFLAAVEDHAAIGVVFAIAAVLCVLGAAFSPTIDHGLKRNDRDTR